MQYYYINLQRRKERNNYFLNEIKKSKILSENIKRFNAIDGLNVNISNVSEKILTPQAKEYLLSRSKNKNFGISITYGAVGCAMSHYELYKQCIKYNQNFCIFEDDAIINPKIDYYITDYINNLTYDVLYFGFHRHSHIVIENIRPLVNRIKGNIWGTFAYVVTPKFCQYAIDHVFPITIQFDSEISKHINQDKIIAMAFNRNVIEATHLGTDIQGNDGIKKQKKISLNTVNDPWDMVFEW